MKVIEKLVERVKTLGPKEAARTTLGDVAERVVGDRTILVLRVDLGDPKVRLRARELTDASFAIAPFDRAALPGLLALAEAHEPWRVDSIRQRFFEGARGFVALKDGAPVGYVYFTEGTDSPSQLVHSDLHWLGVRPRRGEVYVFDYYLVPPARGLGNLFVRHVQDAHHRMGFRAAYGWVDLANRGAAFLYRATGWKEIGRVVERRLLGKVALVGPTIYWLLPRSRVPLWTRAP